MKHRTVLGASLLPMIAIAVTATVVSKTPPPPALHYVTLGSHGLHRQGCLDPDSREATPDVDAFYVHVSGPEAISITIRGDELLEPGLVMLADDGTAAAQSWMREIGGPSHLLHTTVVLPDAGHYSFFIADRRELAGDEMAAGHGCFEASFAPAHMPAPRPLPPSWHGPIDTPTVFEVPLSHRRDALVDIENSETYGAIMVSVFTNETYFETHTVSPGDKTEVRIAAGDPVTWLLVEEEVNTGLVPLDATLRSSHSARSAGAVPSSN